jgi:hypothetical protein
MRSGRFDARTTPGRGYEGMHKGEFDNIPADPVISFLSLFYAFDSMIIEHPPLRLKDYPHAVSRRMPTCYLVRHA